MILAECREQRKCLASTNAVKNTTTVVKKLVLIVLAVHRILCRIEQIAGNERKSACGATTSGSLEIWIKPHEETKTMSVSRSVAEW
jgi:hypothetical protein